MSLRQAVLPLVTVLGLLAGCGNEADPDSGPGSQPETDTETAAELLTRAETTLDEAESVHFVLSSEDVPRSATTVVSGEGDLARPRSFAGTLQVQVLGQSLNLEVVSVDDTVYAQLPFTRGFSAIDPAQYGFTNPGDLLDPETGISQLVGGAEDAEFSGERRVGGEVVQEVTAQIPGELVAQMLANEDPSQPVDAQFSIEPESGELRRAVLTGPFFSAKEDGTYTVELSDYGADVEITAPTG